MFNFSCPCGMPERGDYPTLSGKNNRVRYLLFFAFIGCHNGLIAQQWHPLFDGKTLDGWEIHGGSARFEVVDGTIRGTATDDRQNTFLCTEARYGDFIFEVSMLLPNALNSGIMFRADLREAHDRVYGYQCEVDPSPRAWTGGLYDEARRGWLYPLTRNEAAQDAFRLGTWNTIRIEALGPEVRTYVNGRMTSRLVDSLSREGFFGLQVHGIGGSMGEAGYTVSWRDPKICLTEVAAHRRVPDPQVPEISYLPNRLTDWQRDHGWRLLWDGRTPEGWRGAKRSDFPPSGWTIADGVLTVEATDGGEATGPGDIVTERPYGDFELQLEFQLTEGANSGIKYFVDPNLNRGAGSAIGCEFQLLDDQRHPDAERGVAGNRTLGALYDLIPPASLQNAGRGKQFKGIGQWNHARIVSRNGHVEHWLNHEKVVEYDRFAQVFAALVNYSKYQRWPNFGRWPQGAILLQDHGDTVRFRSIYIREW